MKSEEQINKNKLQKSIENQRRSEVERSASKAALKRELRI